MSFLMTPASPDSLPRLPPLLLVDAAHVDAVGPFYFKGYAFRRRELHGVRQTDGEDNPVSLLLRPVAHPMHLQRLAEPRLHARHHVGHQGARQAVEGAVAGSITGTRHPQLAVLQVKAHVWVEIAGEFAAGSPDGDMAPFDLYLDFGRDGYRLSP